MGVVFGMKGNGHNSRCRMRFAMAGWVSCGMSRRAGRFRCAAFLIVPCGFVVGLFLRVKSGVEPILGKFEALLDDEGSVRVVDDVVFRDAVIFERVANQSAEKRYIRAGSN